MPPGMQSAKGFFGGKLSILPGQATAGPRATIGPMGHPTQKQQTLEHVDFSKPERYVREILDFLQSVTITNDLNTTKTYKTLSG